MPTISTSTSDFRSVEAVVRAVAARPPMYGLDGRYAVLVAFVIGCDAACHWKLLNGFQAWLLGRHLGPTASSSLAWWGLLAHIHVPVPPDNTSLQDSYRDLSESQSKSLVAFLFQELEEFFQNRNEGVQHGKPRSASEVDDDLDPPA